jgi:hypothetical protein
MRAANAKTISREQHALARRSVKVAQSVSPDRSLPIYTESTEGGRMAIDDIIRKFLDDEALLVGGIVAAKKVVAQLADEGVTVYQGTVASVQTITRRVLAIQRERAAADSQTPTRREASC